MHIIWYRTHRIGYDITYTFFRNLTSVWSICYIRLENKEKDFKEKQGEGEIEIL